MQSIQDLWVLSGLHGAWWRLCVGSVSACSVLWCWDTFSAFVSGKPCQERVNLKGWKQLASSCETKISILVFPAGLSLSSWSLATVLKGEIWLEGREPLTGPGWDFFAIITQHVNNGTGWLCVFHPWGCVDGRVGAAVPVNGDHHMLGDGHPQPCCPYRALSEPMPGRHCSGDGILC